MNITPPASAVGRAAAASSLARLLHILGNRLKTYVYVDGFNLYYGSLRNTQYKWLDISKLCGHLLKQNKILKIKYFTANIIARSNDPDQANRQQIYLRALRTIPEIEIHLGHFLSHPVTLPECDQSGQLTGLFKTVIRTEEKGSDVNLASHLLLDAFNNQYEVGVVISNDSDLLTPIKIATEKFGKKIGLINPQKRTSRVLARNANFVKQIRTGVLASSQFSNRITDHIGSFNKPSVW